MTMANSSSGGSRSSVSVNKTPPVGIPVGYPNIGALPTAVPNVPNILTGGAPAHNMATILPVTNGDAGGAMGGVASGTVSATSNNIAGSGVVMLQGMPATRMTDPALQNLSNTVGVGSSPSQTTVQVLG